MTSWDDAVERFAEYLRGERRRYSTVKSYRLHLLSLPRYLGPDVGPWDVTGVQLEAWIDSRGASAPHARKVARVFYGWAVRAGYLETSPAVSGEVAPRRGGTLLIPTPAAWDEPLRGYTAHLTAGGRSVGTIRTQTAHLRRLGRAFPDGPASVARLQLAEWIASNEWKHETLRSVRSAVRGFYAWAVAEGLLAESPAGTLAAVRVPRAFPRPTPDATLTAVLGEATERDRLLILLAAYAGLRCREIAAIRPAEDVQDGFLYVLGKGGNVRRVPLHPVLVVELDAEQARRRAGGRGSGFRWSAELRADGYLFPGQDGGHVSPGSVSRRLGQLLPGRWTAHTLRHRFASSAYAATRDLRAVQELLGHASPATTARYTATPDDALRAAVMGIA